MFEKCKFKMKQDLEQVSKIYDRLYDFVDNRELWNVISKHLINPIEYGYYVDFVTDNEASLKGRTSKNDMFHILVTPSLRNIESIVMKIVDNDGLYEESVIAQFKNDEQKVVVTRRKVEKIIQGKKKEVVDIRNSTNIKSYLDDKLRYTYDYITETCFRLHQNYSKASLEETFIDEDKRAVKRVAVITEDEFYKDPVTINYYETKHLGASPFKNRYWDGILENASMTVTSKETFDKFMKNQDEVVTLKR